MSPTLNAFDNATEVRATVVVYAPEVAACLRSGNMYNNSDPTMESQMLVATSTEARASTLCAETGHGWWKEDDVSGTLTQRDYKDARNVLVAPTLSASNDPSRSPQSSEVTSQVEAVVNATSTVRRLTPVECERLQGFPDDWTVGQADTHRYRQMGNAVTVNVAHYIGWLLADA